MIDQRGGSHRPDQEAIFAEPEREASDSGGHAVNSCMTVCCRDICNS